MDRSGAWLCATVRVATYLAVVAFSLAMLGCTKVPDGKRGIDSLTVRNVSEVDKGDLEDKLATQETTKFLGFFNGVIFDYEVYDRYVLERDLKRIERFYRARGYYEAQVRGVRLETPSSTLVRIEIVVHEGAPIVVGAITMEGTEQLPEALKTTLVREAERAIGGVGKPFDEDKYEATETAVAQALGNAGYAKAKVVRTADVDLAKHAANVHLQIDPGPPMKIGVITFTGLGDLPEDEIRRDLAVLTGETYDSSALVKGQQALLELGLFTQVTITPDVSDAATKDGRVPLKVAVERGKLHTIKLGGGFEFDQVKTDVHLAIGWQASNFLGNLRSFTVTVKPGVVLYPLRVDNITAPTDVLLETRILSQLKQPAFIEARTTGIVTAEYDVYPLILPQQSANVVGYHEPSAAFGLERAFGRVLVSPQYGVKANFPFNDIGVAPQPLDPIVVSYVQASAFLDLRNSPVHVKRGLYAGGTVQYAGLGGDAHDIQIQPEARGYIPIGRRVVIAVRGALGFIFPQDYGDAAQANVGGGNASLNTPSGLAALARDYQILFFRGLYSGGPNSDRGYPLKGVGPYSAVPFFNPTVLTQQSQNGCVPGSAANNPACLFPTGGLSQWEASIEARIDVHGPLAFTFFCDAADVSPYKVDIRLQRPHLSCGGGVRYDTPVGPVRFDLALRIPGLQYLDHPNLSPSDPAFVQDTGEKPQSTLLGLPLAIAFGIGEAF